MVHKLFYQENLTDDQMAVINAFNALPNGDQQQKVVDILYDAMFGRNIRAVLSDGLLSEKNDEIAQQADEIARLKRLATYWMNKTKDSLNIEVPIKAERKAERKLLMKEILVEETFQNFVRQVREQQSRIDFLQNEIKKLQAE